MSNRLFEVFPDLYDKKLENLPLTDDYQTLLTSDTPMIDLRAPVEFDEGAFPSAVSLPLMSDEERHQVGICYKENGQDAAIKLGFELVKDKVKDDRVESWAEFARQNPNAVMYCFRGGMRSQIAQMWLHQHGINMPRIKGGYKALRRYLINQLDEMCQQDDFLVISGYTGTAKTRFINTFDKAIDLEGLANHKGSSFGHAVTPQPKPIEFENQLIIDMLKKRALPGSYLFEDEGNRVGILALPQQLYQTLSNAPIVLLEADLEFRIETIYQDYIDDLLHQAVIHLGAAKGEVYFAHYLTDALARIKKRLAGVRYKELDALLQQALHNGDDRLHKQWIERLLLEYYDPMYAYQLEKKQQRVIFRGSQEAARCFIGNRLTSSLAE